ncbi:hypothetical protein KY349_05390 [Candidatus Woesearchaeota archaeon]|jgi:hypothetical protein|nr:hypothetical protein [Candidatus Woesearchaeota archaeon]
MLRSLTKAQVAFEFVVLVAVLFTALIVFTAFVRENFSDVQSDTDYYMLKDVALFVKSEMNLAAALEDGYRRDFFVPLTIEGMEYNISKENGFITFSSNGDGYTVHVPPYTGTVQKGNNVIKKTAGQIEVNT